MPKVNSNHEKNHEEKQLRKRFEEAELVSNKALAILADGDLDRALGLSQESQRLYEQLSEFDEFRGKKGKAAALTNIAQISLRRGDLDYSLALYQESLLLYTKICAFDDSLGKQGKANSLSQMANVYWEKGDSKQAQLMMEQAIELGKQTGDLEGTAYDITKLGQIKQASGDRKTALDLYHESLAMFEKLDMQPKVVELRQMIATLENSPIEETQPETVEESEFTKTIIQANTAIKRGDVQSAIQHQEQVVILAKELENQKVLIVQMVTLAQYYAMNEQFDNAVNLLEETLHLGETISYPELNTISQLHKTLSSVASLSPEEKSAARNDLRRTQIENAANQVRDAGLAYARKNVPKSDVIKWLEQTANQLEGDESADDASREVAALCLAISALIKEESIPTAPEAYASHFSAVESELKK
jgi:tetratricopeptide (TPR) repeat protein